MSLLVSAPAIVYKYIEGITEAKGNVLTSLCKYWFQTLALPRLEPTNNMCDELAITYNDISAENAKVMD